MTTLQHVLLPRFMHSQVILFPLYEMSVAGLLTSLYPGIVGEVICFCKYAFASVIVIRFSIFVNTFSDISPVFNERDIREGLGSCSRRRERFYLFNSSSIVLSQSSSAPFAMPASTTDGSSLHSASAASRLRW